MTVAVLMASAAQAQTPEEKREASAHHQRGVALYKDGNFSAALSEFRAAYQAIPNPEVLFNIGLCERRLFKYGPAIQSFQAYLEQVGKKVKAERRAAVALELDTIRQLVADITVVVEGAAAKISVDGEVLGVSPLPGPVPLGPGEHVLRAEREGCEPDEARFAVVSGQPRTVRLEPRPLAPLATLVEIVVDAVPRAALVSMDDGPPLKVPAVIPLSPGQHVVVARLEGYESARLEFVVQAGHPRPVNLELRALAAPAPAVSPVVRVEPRRFPVVGVSLLGGGLALGVIGAVFAGLASDASKKVTTFIAGGGAWDATWRATEADGLRANVLAWSMFAGSALALVSGGVLTALGLREPVALLATPGGGLVSVSF